MHHSQKMRLTAFHQSLGDALKPRLRMSTLEWVEKYMYMPTTKALGGKVDVWDTPVIAKLLDILDKDENEVIYITAGARAGKSFCTLAYIGCEITTRRKQILDCWPNDSLIRRQIKGDYNDMVTASPIFKDIIGDENEDKKAGSYKQKRYKNGANLISANMQSSNDMSGVDANVLIIHEVDRAPRTTGQDGAIMNQMFARTQAVWEKKIIIESTPTVEGSVIDAGFQSGTQHEAHFHFTCCGEYHPIRFEDKNEEGAKAGVCWSTDDNGLIIPSTAHYVCKSCGSIHDDKSMKAILYQRGEHELRLIPKYPDRKVVSVHAGWLMTTPFGVMSDIVASYAEALKNGPTAMAGFFNLSLGKSFTIQGSKLDPGELIGRIEDRAKLIVPHGCVMVTAGVDVQNMYLAVQIVAWADNETKYVLYYDEIHGNTSTEDPWNKLFTFLDKELQTEYSGNGYSVTMPIEAICVDTGGTDTQYYYTRLRGKRPRYIAIKGSSRFDAPLFKRPRLQDINHGDGAMVKKGIELNEIGVSQAKVYLYNQLSTAKCDADYGYTHFGSFLGPAYFKELASEELVSTMSSKGDKKLYSFNKLQNRNEALDTFVYAYTAFMMTVGADKEYFDYDRRYDMLSKGFRLTGDVVQDVAYTTVLHESKDIVKNQRIACYVLKNKAWIATEKRFMNAGEIVDLALNDYKEYAKHGLVAPMDTNDKLLNSIAPREKLIDNTIEKHSIVRTNNNFMVK